MDADTSTSGGVESRPEPAASERIAAPSGVRPGDPAGPPLERSDNDAQAVFARRRTAVVLSFAATVLLALTGLVDGVPQLADAGTPRTRLLVALSTASALVAALVARRGAALDAHRREYAFAALPAAAVCLPAANPVYALVTAGLPARHAMMAATCALVATLLLVTAAVRSPGRDWRLPPRSARTRADLGVRTLVAVLATALVGWGLGTALHRVTIDATSTHAAGEAPHLPVSGVAWRQALSAYSYTALPTPLGPAILTGRRLQVLDAGTGRELWHRVPRHAEGEYDAANLFASPDGLHLALLEKTWPTPARPVLQLTVLTDQGRVLRTTTGASGVALTDAHVVTVEGSRAVARDWHGRTAWSRSLVDDCSELETLTHRTVLLVEGCTSTVLTQLDDQGHVVAQTSRRTWGDPLTVHAPDYSSTAFDLDVLRPPAADDDVLDATLMFDDHGIRDLAGCHAHGHVELFDCRPGPDGSLWAMQLGSSSHYTETVLDASGRTTSRTSVADTCTVRPVAGGGIRSCQMGATVQLPGSPVVSVGSPAPNGRDVFPAGSSWVLVTPAPNGTVDIVALR